MVALVDPMATVREETANDFGNENHFDTLEMALEKVDFDAVIITPPTPHTYRSLPWLLKTKSRRDAFKKSVIWTLIISLSYLAIGVGNGVLGDLFSTIGIYVLLVCAFAGPLAYAGVKRLK
jgi:hypothetical protein